MVSFYTFTHVIMTITFFSLFFRLTMNQEFFFLRIRSSFKESQLGRLHKPVSIVRVISKFQKSAIFLDGNISVQRVSSQPPCLNYQRMAVPCSRPAGCVLYGYEYLERIVNS